MRRAEGNSRERARRLLQDAATGYRKLRMPRHVQLAETLLPQALR